MNKLLEEQDILIKKEVAGLNSFDIFMEEWVDNTKKTSKVQSGGSKVYDKMKKINAMLFEKMRNKILVIADLSKYFKSLNVLGKIYFG